MSKNRVDSPMKVTVNLYANLRQYSPGGQGSFEMTLASGSRLASLIDRLQIPAGVKMVMLVNGRRAASDTRLAPADKITLFPPIEGG